jgi:hypothetical protein
MIDSADDITIDQLEADVAQWKQRCLDAESVVEFGHSQFERAEAELGWWKNKHESANDNCGILENHLDKALAALRVIANRRHAPSTHPVNIDVEEYARAAIAEIDAQ